ncbi:response regulator [Myxococcota bacterium]|nr:response regulator [Myxococcota bacterium]
MDAPLLLVEDDADYRELLSDYLTLLGHSVVEFSSAEEALRHVTESAQRPPSLVLTDLRMRRMSGMDLALALRRTHPQLPIILMTAFGERQFPQEAIGLGRSAYVEKPFRLADLASEIERMMALAAK